MRIALASFCSDILPQGGPFSARSTGAADHRRSDLGGAAQGLQYDTVALGQAQQGLQPVLRLIGLQREGEADGAEADRRLAVDPKRAAEIEIALGPNGAAAQLDFERRRDRL